MVNTVLNTDFNLNTSTCYSDDIDTYKERLSLDSQMWTLQREYFIAQDKSDAPKE